MAVKMIDGSEKRNRQLAFELQNSHVCEKRSKPVRSFKILQIMSVLPEKCQKFSKPGSEGGEAATPPARTPVLPC